MGNFTLALKVTAMTASFISATVVVSAFLPAAKPPDAAVERAAEQADTGRYVMAKMVADKVREGLADPQSLQWDDLYTDKAATVVCAEYRAKNGFGGMARTYLSVTKTGASDRRAEWNKHCAGGGFVSEKYVVGLW